MTNGRVKIDKTDPSHLAYLKKTMKEWKLTYADAAKMMNVRKSVLSQYLYGYRNFLPQRYELFKKNLEKLKEFTADFGFLEDRKL